MTMEDTPNGPGAPTDSQPPAPPAASPPPPPPPVQPGAPSGGGKVSENRTVWIILSYLGLLALIPLLVEKEDPEVQWHAKHGLVLMVAEIVAIVALEIVVMILGAISGGLGCLAGLLVPLLVLGILVLNVICMVKGVQGTRFKVPGISDFADRF